MCVQEKPPRSSLTKVKAAHTEGYEWIPVGLSSGQVCQHKNIFLCLFLMMLQKTIRFALWHLVCELTVDGKDVMDSGDGVGDDSGGCGSDGDDNGGAGSDDNSNDDVLVVVMMVVMMLMMMMT